MAKKKSNLMKNTILLSLGTIMTKGINFLMIPLFSRWVSTAEYGMFDLFGTYITLLIPMITLSSGDAIFRFSVESNAKKDKSLYITNGMVIDCGGMIIITAALLCIWKVTGWQRLLPFWTLLLGEVISRYQRGFLRAIKRLDIYSFCSFISAIGIAAFVTLFVRGWHLGLDGMIYGYAAGYIIGDLLIFMITNYVQYFEPKLIGWNTMREMLKFSIPLVPNNLSWWVINVSDRSIIKVFLGTAANGIYAISYKIPNLCSSVFSVFSVAWQEKATEMLDESERNEYYNDIFNKMLLTGLSLVIAITSVNFILFDYIFDAKYYEGHLYAPLLTISVILSMLSLFFGGIQISVKQSASNGISTIIGAIVNVVVHLLLINAIGLYAACISTLISNLVVVFIRNYMIRNVVIFKIRRINFAYLAICAYMITCVYIPNHFIWNIINVAVASIAFWIANKDYIFSAIRRIKSVKS